MTDQRILTEEETTLTTAMRESDPELLGILRDAGHRWGALGVAIAAASLTDRDMLVQQLGGETAAQVELDRARRVLADVLVDAAEHHSVAELATMAAQRIGSLAEALLDSIGEDPDNDDQEGGQDGQEGGQVDSRVDLDAVGTRSKHAWEWAQRAAADAGIPSEVRRHLLWDVPVLISEIQRLEYARKLDHAELGRARAARDEAAAERDRLAATFDIVITAISHVGR